MVNVKSVERAKKNFIAAIPRVSAAYKEGIQGSSGWKEKAIGAETLYRVRMEEALAAGRRAKALEAVSEEEWKSAAANLGAANIGRGMSAKADKQSKNWAPYRDTLAGLELPEKTADPMTNVTNRVGGVVKAMVDKKRELKG